MKLLQLEKNPTLSDFQKYVAQIIIERGFADETMPEVIMLLLEECGELAKAIRKTHGVKTDVTAGDVHVAHEVADIFIYLLQICNHHDIDLEQAFRDKEEVNKNRVWQ